MLLFFMVLIYILMLAFFIFMGIRFRFLLPTKSGCEIFEYPFSTLCTMVPKSDPRKSQHCDPDTWNGVQFTRLEWVSNPQRDQYFSHYYIQQSTYVYDAIAYEIQNYWITIFDKTKNTTAGSARFSTSRQEKVMMNYSRAKVPFTTTRVSAASGLLSMYDNANVLIDYRKEMRRVYIYTENSASSPVPCMVSAA